jgi:putative ABC transport system ATP-binding protein
MAVLEARGVTKVYSADGVDVHALRGVDFAVGAGELVGVMGPSGCGKSTLLHLLGALDTPTTGEILLDGAPLQSMKENDLTLIRRRRIGFVFQFYNLVPVLNVQENVGLPMVIDGKPSPDRVAHVLDSVGIGGLAAKLPAQLSGGEQQRVALARALVNEPSLLLADEPTGNLDLRAGRELMELVLALNASGQTVVIVTHDPNVAAFARRVVFMRDGRLVDEISLDGSRDPAPLIERLVKLGD